MIARVYVHLFALNRGQTLTEKCNLFQIQSG